MPKKIPPRMRKPCAPRLTIEQRLNVAKIEGRAAGQRDEYEAANQRGVVHAVQLNAKLHGVVSQLQGVAESLARACNDLAEIIRQNTPTPRDTFGRGEPL